MSFPNKVLHHVHAHIRLERILLALFILAIAFKFSGLVISRFHSSPVQPAPASVVIPVSSGTVAPDVSARNVFILDRKSGVVLYEKGADEQIYPASTTKMMTALVAYEKYSLETVITVDKSYPEGVNIGLQPGEKVKVADLIYAMLVQSANDSAEVLAAGLPGGRDEFIAQMNFKAAQLRLSNTHFLNPTGLDQDGHYSSAADLARLADALISHPLLAKIVATENAVISSADYSSYHTLSNVNRLLGQVSGVVGVKTGFTDLAGESLVTLISRDGHEVIISLLGSTDRFSDTRLLIDWIYSSFTWQ